ncbi:hypothetical protein CHUAL_011345 [Chamberlinius hualienensis]
MTIIPAIVFFLFTFAESHKNIGKEFDFPPIFYKNIGSNHTSKNIDEKSDISPLIELKNAMGPLPARLPPIFYHHQHGHGHGPYEGDFKIMYNNDETQSMLSFDMNKQPQSAESSFHPSIASNGQQIPMQLSQNPMEMSPMINDELLMMQSQLSQSSMVRRPVSKTSPRPSTSAKPTTPKAPPPPQPFLDYTEENIWLFSGLWLTALILRALGTDVNFQVPVLVGRRRRDVEEQLPLIDLTAPVKENSDDQCMELAACQTPQWTKFYLDNLALM